MKVDGVKYEVNTTIASEMMKTITFFTMYSTNEGYGKEYGIPNWDHVSKQLSLTLLSAFSIGGNMDALENRFIFALEAIIMPFVLSRQLYSFRTSDELEMQTPKMKTLWWYRWVLKFQTLYATYVLANDVWGRDAILISDGKTEHNQSTFFWLTVASLIPIFIELVSNDPYYRCHYSFHVVIIFCIGIVNLVQTRFSAQNDGEGINALSVAKIKQWAMENLIRGIMVTASGIIFYQFDLLNDSGRFFLIIIGLFYVLSFIAIRSGKIDEILPKRPNTVTTGIVYLLFAILIITSGVQAFMSVGTVAIVYLLAYLSELGKMHKKAYLMELRTREDLLKIAIGKNQNLDERFFPNLGDSDEEELRNGIIAQESSLAWEQVVDPFISTGLVIALTFIFNATVSVTYRPNEQLAKLPPLVKPLGEPYSLFKSVPPGNETLGAFYDGRFFAFKPDPRFYEIMYPNPKKMETFIARAVVSRQPAPPTNIFSSEITEARKIRDQAIETAITKNSVNMRGPYMNSIFKYYGDDWEGYGSSTQHNNTAYAISQQKNNKIAMVFYDRTGMERGLIITLQNYPSFNWGLKYVKTDREFNYDYTLIGGMERQTTVEYFGFSGKSTLSDMPMRVITKDKYVKDITLSDFLSPYGGWANSVDFKKGGGSLNFAKAVGAGGRDKKRVQDAYFQAMGMAFFPGPIKYNGTELSDDERRWLISEVLRRGVKPDEDPVSFPTNLTRKLSKIENIVSDFIIINNDFGYMELKKYEGRKTLLDNLGDTVKDGANTVKDGANYLINYLTSSTRAPDGLRAVSGLRVAVGLHPLTYSSSRTEAAAR